MKELCGWICDPGTTKEPSNLRKKGPHLCMLNLYQLRNAIQPD